MARTWIAYDPKRNTPGGLEALPGALPGVRGVWLWEVAPGARGSPGAIRPLALAIVAPKRYDAGCESCAFTV